MPNLHQPVRWSGELLLFAPASAGALKDVGRARVRLATNVGLVAPTIAVSLTRATAPPEVIGAGGIAGRKLLLQRPGHAGAQVDVGRSGAALPGDVRKGSAKQRGIAGGATDCPA